jgi:hypothetical protein
MKKFRITFLPAMYEKMYSIAIKRYDSHMACVYHYGCQIPVKPGSLSKFDYDATKKWFTARH